MAPCLGPGWTAVDLRMPLDVDTVSSRGFEQLQVFDWEIEMRECPQNYD